MHLADAHLDSPFQGLSFLPSNEFENIKQSTQKSFTKAIDSALDRNVDLVLIAGDTFDSVHPSPQSQLFFNREIKRLTDQKIQVVMILGNHDLLLIASSKENVLFQHVDFMFNSNELGKINEIEVIM